MNQQRVLRPRRSLALVTAAVAIGLSVPAFAASADHSFAAGEPADASKPFRVIELIMSEGDGSMTYAPSEIVVQKGEQVKFVIKNEGELDHEFTLDSVERNAKHKLAMQKTPEMEHADPNRQRVASKNSAEVVWRFTKLGTFEFACLIPGHYEAGMHGKVVVK